MKEVSLKRNTDSHNTFNMGCDFINVREQQMEMSNTYMQVLEMFRIVFKNAGIKRLTRVNRIN